MSEQRKLRSEVKQGLHQFLMTLYHSYKKTMSHEDALQEISHCIKQEYEYFIKIPLTTQSTGDLTSSIKSLEKQAKFEKDAQRQMTLYEDLETLMSAQEILLKRQPQEAPHDN